MTTLHVYNRRQIMRRAHQIARETREAKARKDWEDSFEVICGRPVHTKSMKACLVDTPLDISSAMKEAWAEAKRGEPARGAVDRSRALVVLRPAGALAARRRGFRLARVLPLLARVARFIGARYIGRAA